MAKYQIGNRFFSEEEYQDHVCGVWFLWLFVFGIGYGLWISV